MGENHYFSWNGLVGPEGVHHVWVNQGWREAVVVATMPGHEGWAKLLLVEYEMPNGTTALWEAGIDAEGQVVKRGNVSYSRISKAWIQALADCGGTLQANPQQAGPSKRARLKAELAEAIQKAGLATEPVIGARFSPVG